MSNQVLRPRLFVVVIAAFVAAASAAGAADEVQRQCHTLPEPKVVYIADSTNREAFAELLRHVVPARVEFVPLGYNDQDMHHLCDKPLEETREDQEYVRQQGAAYVDSVLARLNEFDLIIAQFQPRGRNAEQNERIFGIERRIVERVKAGGRLVFINPSWETTFADTPLAEVMPGRFDGHHRAWAYSPGTATDHSLVRGIPLEVCGAHWWGPVYEPVDDTCVPLTRSRQAQFWYRKLAGGGQVVHLFQVTGERYQWRGGSYDTYQPNRPDDSAAWNMFLRRLVYGLVYGDAAFPVLVNVQMDEDAAFVSGRPLRLAQVFENRTDKQVTVRHRVTISNRRSKATLVKEGRATLEAGASINVATEFTGTENIPCTDEYVCVAAEAVDANTGRLLSECVRWLRFVHAVPVTITAEKSAFQPGERVTATVSWSEGAQPGDYTVHAYLVDRRGMVPASPGDDGQGQSELLGEGGRRVTIEANAAGSFGVTFRMPAGRPASWLTVVFEADDRIAGTARKQLYCDEPWSMRKEFQWSLWSWGGSKRRLDLYEDAGFNALGMQGNSHDAEERGWGQYVEGTGINTFGVEINYDNWADLRAWMEKTIARLNESGPDSRTKCLVSLGEESGFKGGWGTRYYWDGDTAPEIPQKVFDDYLSELYGGKIADLNAEWGTDYTSFAQVPLEKDKVRAPAKAFVTAQAWEAMQQKGEAKDVFPVDVDAVDPKQKYIAKSAPYYETNNFFDWYYQKYCDMATEVYRSNRNPVPRTIMSAPGGFYPKVDVYNFAGQGPFYPKEAGLVGNEIARRDYGDVPGFSAAMWAYFDLRSLWSCTVMSSILVGNTHIDYWVDTPLTFNTDMTHTRASFWTKVLREQLRPVEPIILHKRVAYTRGLVMFTGRQPVSKGILGRHFGSAITCNPPVYSAMEKSGYMPRVVHTEDLGGMRVLVASYAQVVSPEEGRDIAEFVRGGGTLITTPWLASCSPHGNLLTVYPAVETGLAELLGFRLLNTSQDVAKEKVSITLEDGDPTLTMLSSGRDVVEDMAADVAVRATYEDGTPLLLERTVGRGRVIYLNMVFDWEGWWNAFHSESRENYRKLFDALLRSAGVQPEYFLAFETAEAVDDNKGWWGMVMASTPQPGESVAWWASQLYQSPDGGAKYLGVFSDHRSPKITARLQWGEAGKRFFNLLTGVEVPAADGPPKLTLRPGEGAFLAITDDAPEDVELRVLTPRVTAGSVARFVVRLAGVQRPHALRMTVDGPDEHLATRHMEVTREATVQVPVPLNAPVGRYAVEAVESITRKKAGAAFDVVAGGRCPAADVLKPFPPRPGEDWPQQKMTTEEFLGLLRKLREIYDGTYEGLEAKYMLSYYLNVPFRPNNRHAIMRQLQRTDWSPHWNAVMQAMANGEYFYLIGEDFNIDPATGKTIDPFAREDIQGRVGSIMRTQAHLPMVGKSGDVSVRMIRVGDGGLIVSAASVDRTAYLSADFVVWHNRLKEAIRKAKGE